MSRNKIISKQGLHKPRGWPLSIPRVLAAALGLILLTAVLLKAIDMELFIRQITAYGIISSRHVVVFSAWFFIALESALGVGLLVHYRPRLMLLLTAILLLVFVGATAFAWFTGATQDCGCFGAWLKHTPGEAALGNLILLAAAVLAWVGHGHAQVAQTGGKAWAVTTACLVGLALPVIFGFSVSGIFGSDSKTGPVKLWDVHIQGLDYIDLNYGTYLIILMGTDCLHCQEAVPQLNMLAGETDLQDVIALCTNGESERLAFVEEFQPMFPVGQISENVFWRLLGSGDIPRYMLVRDQHVLHTWDQDVPDKDTIQSALSEQEF